MRMFAGPNGSGKSTFKSYLSETLLGVYLNPDDIEKEIKEHGSFDLASCKVISSKDEVLTHFKSSSFLKKAGYLEEVSKLRFANGRLSFDGVTLNSYWASVLVDFLRVKLLNQKESFTFETVMSHPDKIKILETAQTLGYRTYLYYVATDDPLINISRVHNRVKLGGHPVPDEKVSSRYYRSLDLLSKAIRSTHRAYIFDNSGDSSEGKQTWLAEITNAKDIELKTDQLPAWFVHALLHYSSKR